MNIFGNNLKVLRKGFELTQNQLAEKLGINRATLASYEEGRAEPKFDKLKRIASFFKVSTDDLILATKEKKDDFAEWERKDLQILPIVVDNENMERISLVPKKASAGYLKGLEDAEFIGQLPSFSLPVEQLNQGTFRAFEIEGDSMLPIQSGSYIIAKYEDDWRAVKDGKAYIVVSENDGLTFKRVEIDLRKEILNLTSDNKGYDPYSIPLYEVRELWEAKAILSFELDQVKTEKQELSDLSKMLFDLKSEVEHLKSSGK